MFTGLDTPAIVDNFIQRKDSDQQRLVARALWKM